MRKFALLVLAVVFGWSSGAFGASYSDSVLADNPIGYWRLNETAGTVAQDATGSYDGTYVSAPDLGEPGALNSVSNTPIESGNTSIGLTGTRTADPGQYILLPLDQSLSLHATDFTIEAWVNPTAVDPIPCGYSHQQCDTIFFQQKGFSTGHDNEVVGFNLWSDRNSGDLYADMHLFFYGDNGFVADAVPINEWSHVAVSYTDSTKVGRFYVNGAEVHQHTFAAGPSNMTSIVGSQIGASYINGYGTPVDSSGNSWYRDGRMMDFDGGLDEVAVYKTALTSSQIQTHFLAAVPEPNTALLLGVGLMGFGMRRRRTRRGCI